MIDWIGDYHQGVAVFRRGGLYGVMVTGGSVLIQPQYDYIASFGNGYAKAIRGGCCFVVDLSGKEYKTYENTLVPLLSKYDFVRDFMDGIACIEMGGKWGAINIDGQEIVPPTFDYITDFVHGVAKGIKEVQPHGYANHWCMLNSEGECFDFGFKYYTEPVIVNGLVSLQVQVLCAGENRLTGLYSDIRLDSKGHFAPKNGKNIVVLDAKYTDYNVVRDFSGGLSCVQDNNGYWGAIDTMGKTVIPFDYLRISDFNNNCGFAENRDKEICLLSDRGIILKKLSEVSDFEPFNNGVAIVYKATYGSCRRYLRGSCGLINDDGSLILDFFEGNIERDNENPTAFILKSKSPAGTKVGYFNALTGARIEPKYDGVVAVEQDCIIFKVHSLKACRVTCDGHPFVLNGGERVLLPQWCLGGEDFQNGICKALGTNKKWGLINESGETVCEPTFEYKDIGDVNGFFVTLLGRGRISRNYMWSRTAKENSRSYGVVNTLTKVVIPAEYDEVPHWNGDFYIATRDKYYGIIAADGKVVTKPQYESIESLGKFYKVEKESFSGRIVKHLIGVIDKQGEYVIAPRYTEIKVLNKYLYAGKLSEDSTAEKWELFNESGIVTGHYYDSLAAGNDGYVKFQLNGKDGSLDMDGNIVVHDNNGDIISVPSSFEWCSDFVNGYASAMICGHDNYVDEDFSIILVDNNSPIRIGIPLDYVVEQEPDGNYIYSQNGKMGLLAKDGTMVLPAAYSKMHYFSTNRYIVSEGNLSDSNKVGLIDVNGNVILEAKYDEIQRCSFGYFMKRSARWKAYDKTFNPICEREFDSYEEREDGYFTIIVIEKCFGVEVKKMGILSPFGVEKLAPIYSSIGTFNEEKFPSGFSVISTSLYGIINKNYDIIITPQFSSIFDFENGYCVVIKMVDGLQIVGAVDANGRYADLEKLGNEPVSKLENGLTIVKSITSYPLFSLMDSNGMLLLPFKYNTIELLENGQYRVSVGNVYEKMELWEDEPQFRVAVGNILYGVLNDKLEEIIRPKYTDIEDCGSCYILSEGQQTELGDLCGKIIVPNRYQIRRAAEHLFWIYEANTMNSSRRNTNKEGLYGLINENGEMLLSPRYYQIQDFINGFACVMGGGRWVEEDDESSQVYRDGHWGVIDTDGKEIIPLLYDAIKYEADASLFKVNFSKVHSGYIDIRGKRVIKGPDGKFMAVSPNYQWQDDYEGGVSTVYYSGSKGRVNDRGEQLIYYQKDGVQLETILPAQFDWGYDSDSQCIIVEKENNVGLYSAVEDRIVLELQYKGIQAVRTADRTHRLWRTISRSGRYGLATEIGEVVLPAKYWGIRPLAFALFEVMVEGWEYVLLLRGLMENLWRLVRIISGRMIMRAESLRFIIRVQKDV